MGGKHFEDWLSKTAITWSKKHGPVSGQRKKGIGVAFYPAGAGVQAGSQSSWNSVAEANSQVLK
jgi:hypothetical protein